MSSRVSEGYSSKTSSIESPAPKNSRMVWCRDPRAADHGPAVADFGIDNDSIVHLTNNRASKARGQAGGTWLFVTCSQQWLEMPPVAKLVV